MNPGQYKRVTELFLEAVELESGQRDAFLDDACGQDRELRREVDLLLSHDSNETIIDRGVCKQSVSRAVNTASMVVPAKHSPAWLRTARLTPYLGRRGQFALGALAAVVFLVMLAAVVQQSIVTFQRTLRAAALQEILDAKIAGLEMWIDHEQEMVMSWSRANELRGRIKELVDLAADEQTTAESIRTSPLQGQLRDAIFRMAGQEVRYQLWDRKHATLADEPEMKAIGGGVTAFGGAVLTEVFAGKSHFITYDRHQSVAVNQSAIHGKSGSGTLVPVRDFHDNIIAALLIVDHDAPETVSRIFRLVDLGLSGETYAFNSNGVLLTESRFDDQLRSLWLITDEPD